MDWAVFLPFFKEVPMLATSFCTLFVMHKYMGKPLLDKLDGMLLRIDNLTEGVIQHKITTSEQLGSMRVDISRLESKMDTHNLIAIKRK